VQVSSPASIAPAAAVRIVDVFLPMCATPVTPPPISSTLGLPADSPGHEAPRDAPRRDLEAPEKGGFFRDRKRRTFALL
jgi:hypothetical protein